MREIGGQGGPRPPRARGISRDSPWTRGRGGRIRAGLAPPPDRPQDRFPKEWRCKSLSASRVCIFTEAKETAKPCPQSSWTAWPLTETPALL